MLTLTPLPGLPMIQPGDDLAALILEAMRRANLHLEPGDIFVLAQKIVSKTEGRKVNLATVTPSPRARDLAAQIEKDPRLIELILQESNGEVLRTRPGLIVVEHRLGFVCANAGIDHSNVAGDDEWVLLLPENPDASAERLRAQWESTTGTQVGVMIIDSHGRAWRNGTVGVAIGISGLPGVVDLRGQADLNGRILQVTQVGAADELAAAASLVMGQAAEGTPVVHVRGFPYPLREGSLKELIRPKELDLFR
ncbi:MAG: coenzyme F420-0:L-glutamate ligase [Anaerolineales bacterium]|nr:coenzyme F420-0:L-glutamate ligase [Anaerolineales bacterium]